MNIYIKNKSQEFDNAIEFFKKEIGNIRTGRANPNVLEGIQAEAYGVKTPLNGVANISIADGQSLLISPWDKNNIKAIEKAIIEADLGLGVVNEGDRIRLTVPKMTEESRKELVKSLNDKMETARISIRQVRDEVKNAIEEAKDNKEITEDEKFKFINELDEEVHKINDEMKDIRDKKEKEIMTI